MKRYFLTGFLLTIGALIAGSCSMPSVAPVPAGDTSNLPTAPGVSSVSPDVLPLDLGVGSMMVWVDNSLLVYVPGGEFVMGANGEDTPQHTVTLSPFWIYRTEVSNRAYALCVAAGKCSPPLESKSAERFADPLFLERPVVGVNWDQSSQYCAWMEGHLPTEAQWEKTGRGPTGNLYPWGEDTPTCDLLNFNNCSGDISGVFGNPAGKSYYEALNMSGNVFEWVQDWYSGTYYRESPSSDPPGPASGTNRVVCSSSYYSFEADVVLAKRSNTKPEDARPDLGFRCVVESPSYHPPFYQFSPRNPPSGNVPTGNPSNGCEPAKVEVGGAYCSSKTPTVNVKTSGDITISGSGVNCQRATNGLYVCTGSALTTVAVSACSCGDAALPKVGVPPQTQAPTGCGDDWVYDMYTRLCYDVTSFAAGTPVAPRAPTPFNGFCPVGMVPGGSDMTKCYPVGQPVSTCVGGFTYDPASKTCKADPGSKYPGCPDQVYDPLLGCLTPSTSPDPSAQCQTITLNFPQCGSGKDGGGDSGGDSGGEPACVPAPGMGCP